MFGNFGADDEMFDGSTRCFDKRRNFMKFDSDIFHRIEGIETILIDDEGMAFAYDLKQRIVLTDMVGVLSHRSVALT